MTVRGNTLFAGSDGSAVFRSDNNGASWAVMNGGLVSWFIKSLYTMDDKVFAGTLGGLFRLDENSSSFINVNGIIQWAAVLSFCHDGPMLYVGADGGGVYYSLDYGNSWAQWNDGLPNFNIHSLGIYNSKIFAGTCCGFGLWKRPVLPFTGIDLISRHNEIIVYPDPAKDVINVEISFQNLSTDAQISIYNMAGLLVKQQRFLYGKARIDIGDLVNGHYLIGTQDKYKVSVSKFEKVK
jgi:hypothetical protein